MKPGAARARAWRVAGGHNDRLRRAVHRQTPRAAAGAGSVSARSRLNLGTISAAPRPHLGRISAISRLHLQVGGFHIFHVEDLRLIAPLWLEYTKKVRNFAHQHPQEFFAESMMPLDPKERRPCETNADYGRWCEYEPWPGSSASRAASAARVDRR